MLITVRIYFVILMFLTSCRSLHLVTFIRRMRNCIRWKYYKWSINGNKIVDWIYYVNQQLLSEKLCKTIICFMRRIIFLFYCKRLSILLPQKWKVYLFSQRGSVFWNKTFQILTVILSIIYSGYSECVIENIAPCPIIVELKQLENWTSS